MWQKTPRAQERARAKRKGSYPTKKQQEFSTTPIYRKPWKSWGINYRSLNWRSPDFEPSTVETHLFFFPFSSFEGLYLIDANGSNGLPTCSMSSALGCVQVGFRGTPEKPRTFSIANFGDLPVSLFDDLYVYIMYPWNYMSLHQHPKKKIQGSTWENQFLSCCFFLQWRLSVRRWKAGAIGGSQSNISKPWHFTFHSSRRLICAIYMGVSENRGTPKWMVKIMENPIEMDDLGVPLFSETSISFQFISFHSENPPVN